MGTESTATAASPAGVAAAPAATAPAPAAAAPAATEGATAAAAPAASASAPAAAPAEEEYGDFTAPEGTVLDKEVADQFKGLAKSLKLPHAEAAKIVTTLAPLIAKGEAARTTTAVTTALEQFANKQKTDHEATVAQWRKDAAALPELGGEKFNENLAIAKKTFDAFADVKLGEFLAEKGLADHPLLLQWAYRIGKQIGPDNKLVSGLPASAGEAASPADKLWPDRKTA